VTGVVAGGKGGGQSPAERLSRLYDATGVLPVLLCVLILVLAVCVPHFASVENVLNVLRSSSFLMMVACGQMLVLIVGGFDLSVGSVVALASVVSASVMAGLKGPMVGDPGLIILLGVLAGLGCGVVVGLVNGLCVAWLRISPFMVTLGTMSIAEGVAFLLTNGIPVYGMPVGYVRGFGRGLWFDLPAAVYLALLVVAAIWVVQNMTRMGRYIFAIGGNLDAALVSGVRTKTYLVAAYVLCAMLAALTGLALTAEIGSGQASMGAQLTLESIAAAVIAGVSLRGGVGRVELVALGSIFLLILTNAMDLLNIDSRLQTVFIGIILVLAVAAEEMHGRGRLRARR
jgi:ribose transport system permease protein